MAAQSSSPGSTPTERTPNPNTVDDANYREILHMFLEAGADLLEDLRERTASATPPKDPIGDYDRLSRAVRKTIMLARHIAEHPIKPIAADAHKRAAARAQIIRKIEDSINRNADEDEAESLRDELSEHLDRPDLDDDIASRPIQQIIDEIRSDLGLDPYTAATGAKRRTPEQVRDLWAEAAQPTREPAHIPDD